MHINKVLDNITSFIIDPSNDNRRPLAQGIAWCTTIFLGIGTIGIVHGLSALWRKLRRIDKNETHEKISQLFLRIFPKASANSRSSSESKQHDSKRQINPSFTDF